MVCFTWMFSSEEAFAEELETIQLEIKYTNGDIVDYNGVKIIVYQDFNKSPIIERTLQGNPDLISVPENHRYKIEVYANGMYADVGYVQLKNKSEKTDINIPLSGGLQFEILYKNGHPINEATVILKSQDNEEWRKGVTNDEGNTLRYWVQSTNNQDDHYIADVYLGEIFLTSYYPIKLQPGLPFDQKIITNIPETVEELITVNLFAGEKKITSNDGKYKVTLIDLKGNHVDSSELNSRGDAYFSNLKSGSYVVKITSDDLIEEALWPQQNIHIIGDVNKFNIFRNNENIDLQDNPSYEKSNDIVIKSEVSADTCNCVAFRLDGVQDYWLNQVQIDIMKTFTENKTPLTIGIIANAFGNDKKITDFVKEYIVNRKADIEVATKGIGLTPYTNYDLVEQNENLKKSIQLIESTLNVTPHVFIPPNNKFNKDTLEILQENKITHISTSLISGETPPFELKGNQVYRFPQITSTGKFNFTSNVFDGLSSQQVVKESIQGIKNYGFAVISIQPQEFAMIVNSTYTNTTNEKQITELKSMINEFKQKGYKIVTIGKINSNLVVQIPEWIKNNAGWWANGDIDDNTFVLGIEYLVKNGIIHVTEKSQKASNDLIIPEWIKNNAGWWANGDIDDNTFVLGIEYLVKNGIITY